MSERWYVVGKNEAAWGSVWGEECDEAFPIKTVETARRFASEYEGTEIYGLVQLDELEAMERERSEMLEALHDSLGALKSVQEYASSEMVDGQIDDLVDLIARAEGTRE